MVCVERCDHELKTLSSSKKPFFNCLIFTDIVRISLGTGHSIIMKRVGSVWATGGNSYGELGTGSKTNFIVNFVEVVSGAADVIAAGGRHSIVLKQDGSVWATGRNMFGQLGSGSNTAARERFVKVIPSGVKAIAAGSKHSLVVREDDSVWAAGCNMYGQLGDGSKVDRNIFVQALIFPYGVKAVAAGEYHSLLLGQDGSVWATGANSYGQLGIASKQSTSEPTADDESIDDDETRDSTSSFVQVPFVDAKAVAAGSFHSMVLKKDGSVWAAGANDFGQLGDKSTSSRKSIRQVYNNLMQPFDAKAIAAGSYHSIVLGRDGSVWATGRNDYGQLGVGSKSLKITFVQVISRAQAVAAGGWHSMVLRDDGSFWAAGRNSYGQLGDGSSTDKTKFVRLTQISDQGA